MLITCAGLLSTYWEIRLRHPIIEPNKDIVRVETPRAADNHGNDFILGGGFNSKRPTSWSLQEVENRNFLSKSPLATGREEGGRVLGL